jgi:hypothetical protein
LSIVYGLLTTTAMTQMHRQGGDAASSAAPPARHRISRHHGWSTTKVVGVGIFCFVGGMQVDRGSIVQINLSTRFPHTASANDGKVDPAGDAALVGDDGAKEVATLAKVFKEASDTPVDIISLLGERHSGTNWITDHLQECFGDRVKVSKKTRVY